ncbi:DUF7507 domain-containing protein [Paenibacillus agilis]|uniref:DUF11 domain-containing protein n=1 Tax=Paenibacillus agilis TaxID=3020863 RepID=A0A559J1H3_9BACL|nr:SdrD B-like domain-containing protein [Paenibacillus agilis]TVX93740.1 DUF11 domain-containing protein [Paenibacillus agilis]
MPATITGIVFNDLNHNGTFNPGEPGIPNVFVVLFSSSAGTCTSVQTDANGNYSFSITTAGTYTVYEPVANPGATCPPTTFTQPSGFTVSNGPRKLTVTVTAAQVTGNATIANQNFSHDTTNNPLFCTATMVQFSGQPTQWFNINLVTGTAISQGIVNPAVSINAIGYNPLDNYIYGYDRTNNLITRVDRSGNVTDLAPLPPGLPADDYICGTFDLSGFLYLLARGASRFFVVDLRPNTATFMKLVNPANGFQEQTSNFGVAFSKTPTISDWVFRPLDGNLYGVDPSGPVIRIVPTTGAVTNLTTTPLVTATSFGAMAIDAADNIYAISNTNGGIYRYTITGNKATSARFSTTITTNLNDATLCPFITVGVDYGDAPDTGAGNGPSNYSTLLANNGPRHQTTNTLFLGTRITTEQDAFQNPTATGDDISKGIQDDGLTVPLPAIAVTATSYLLNVTITNNTGSPANLYGWVDFNDDGIFQANEAAPVQVVPSQTGTQIVTLPFTVPAGVTLVSGQTFVRLRLTTDNLVNQNTLPTAEDTRSLGAAADGEVEDYIVLISAPAMLSITKTASTPTALPGDSVNYTFTVTNTGNVTLTNVRIEDSLLGLIDVLSSLAPGVSTTIIVQFIVPPGTLAGTIIDNTATATSDQTPPIIDTAQVTVLPSFSLAIAKTVDQVAVAPGTTVSYTITVSNTSNAPITNVTVTDDLLGFSQVIPSLDVGQSQTFSVPFTVPLGTTAGTVFTNQSVGTSDETPPTSDTATIIVTPIPDAIIFKSVTPQIAAPGETVTYTITVTNAGNQTLTNVHIVDPTISIDQTFAALNPGDTVVVTMPFVIPLTAMQGDTIVNVSTVTTDQTAPGQADAVVTVISAPGISISKSVAPTQAAVGDTVTYTFVVTNTGNTPLTSVQLSDPLLGIIQSIGSLAVGESRTITFPFVVSSSSSNPFINTATVTGTAGTQSVQDSSTAALALLLPAFTVAKSVNQPQANPGDTVMFTITVTNTGNIDLTNVVISDPVLSYQTTIDTLATGASVIESIPFTIPNDATPGSTITNVVTVTPTETGPQQDTTTITVNEVPDITITKTPDQPNGLPGDTITYTITVTNTGNIPLTNVTVSDPFLGFSTNIPTLAVGQSQSFAPTFTIPAGTAIGTIIRNVSTVTSDQTPPEDDNATVLVNPLPPLLTLVKTTDRFTAAPGDTVNYTITVTNPGTVSLTNVFFNDDILGINQTVGTLDPGQSQAFTFAFTIPAGTPSGTVIVNTAVAESDQTNPEEGRTSVTIDPAPLLQITKTIDPSQAVPGQSVTVTLTVTNTGNVDLSNVVIEDAAIDFRSVIPNLPVGSSSSIPLPFVTPNLPAGTVLTNTATATSNETVPTSATASFTVLSLIPSLTLDKQVNPSVASPGENVTFTFEFRNTSNGPLTNLHFTDELLGIDKTVDFVPAGFSVSLTQTFTIPADTIGGTVITNTAVLTTAETAPVTATVQVTVPADPQLTISKTVFPPTALPGEVVFFSLHGVNTGNVPLTNISYNDPLLSISGTVVSQDVGEVLSLIIPFTIPPTSTPGQPIINTAFVDSVQTGLLSTSATVNVTPLPIEVTKKADCHRIFVGDTVTFRITMTNTGSVTATNVLLTDVLQTGTKFVPKSVKIDGKHIPDANPQNGISLGSIAPGQSVQVSFEVKQVCLPPKDKVRNTAAVNFQLDDLAPVFTVESNTVVIQVEEHHE